ncbi:MAG: hypothetical protein RMM31_06145 [Anaerolineae bacterium]|nr:hypothetical protein [Thermoflexales bacterium]MDW8395802.1 hypothetical protein [Anaerolineae bacterium]
MQRSRFSAAYWALFVVCLVLVAALNLPWPGLPAQDASALLRDPWFLWGFNYFGLLIMPMAALMVDDGRRRGMRWAWYVIPYFAVGILPLSVYMARRPAQETHALPTPRVLEQRWLWALLAVAVIPISVFFLPQGTLDGLVDTMSKNLGLAFMWLDIALNHVIALPLAQADMRRRGVAQQAPWLAAILLTGPLALCAYMAVRPRVLAQPSPSLQSA